MSAAMTEYDTHLTVERNLSPATRRAYQFDLGRFRAHLAETLGADPELSAITASEIRAYLGHLQGHRAYKSTSLSRAISSIRVFFDYCVRMKHLAASPSLDIHNPKLPRKLPVYLIDSELRDLLAAPSSDDRAAVRDYAILVTLGCTGMRRQELVDLDIRSLDLERRTLLVTGKGNKERLIPMNSLVLEAINGWLDVRSINSGSEALFLNNRLGRLGGRSIVNIVKKYVERSGISKTRVSPHKLRHTFATLLHMNDVDIVEIKTLLGHSSIASTQIYTHTTPTKQRRAVDGLVYIGPSATPFGVRPGAGRLGAVPTAGLAEPAAVSASAVE